MSNEDKFRSSLFFRTATAILYTLHVFRSLLHILLFVTSPSRSVIEKDIRRWMEMEHTDLYEKGVFSWRALVWLLWKDEPYRNLFYYRIKKDYRIASRIILEFAQVLYKPRNTLFIKAGSIGEGFFIQHGYATGIGARSIGKNCWVNQHVVVGYSDAGKSPILGDNVHIAAGAKVLGDITIGDNSIVGANAVVVKNVPPNCTVVGVPARIIKRDGKRVDEPL
jgi:serine O-acetyltransferase